MDDVPLHASAARTRAEKLQADQAMVDFLRPLNFEGSMYEEWIIEEVSLVGGRLLANIRSGSAFGDRRCRWPVFPTKREQEVLRLDQNQADDILDDAVTLTLPKFRDTELVGGGWHSSLGATIGEHLYGATVQRLPQAYRGWSATQKHVGHFTRDVTARIFLLESKGRSPSEIAITVGAPEPVVARILRGVVAADGEFSTDVLPDVLTHDASHDFEARQGFEKMLATVSKKYRMVARMLEQGYAPGEIQKKLGLSASSYRRAKRKLGAELRRAGYAPDIRDVKGEGK